MPRAKIQGMTYDCQRESPILRRSHILFEFPFDAVSRSSPLALVSRDVTSPTPGSEFTRRPERTSQNRTVPSLLPDTAKFPFSLYPTHVTLAP